MILTQPNYWELVKKIVSFIVCTCMFIDVTFSLQKDQTQELEFLGDCLQCFNVCASWEKLGNNSHSLGMTNNVSTHEY